MLSSQSGSQLFGASALRSQLLRGSTTSTNPVQDGLSTNAANKGIASDGKLANHFRGMELPVCGRSRQMAAARGDDSGQEHRPKPGLQLGDRLRLLPRPDPVCNNRQARWDVDD